MTDARKKFLDFKREQFWRDFEAMWIANYPFASLRFLLEPKDKQTNIDDLDDHFGSD